MLDPSDVRFIVVHCSATPPTMNIGRQEIDRWHRQRGFREIGYHYVIRRDGSIEVGRDLDKVGAHVEGYNAVSYGICLVGGVDADNQPEDNFEKAQKAALIPLIEKLLARSPKAKVLGHRDLPRVNKACPSFDVKEWWGEVNNA